MSLLQIWIFYSSVFFLYNAIIGYNIWIVYLYKTYFKSAETELLQDNFESPILFFLSLNELTL